MIGRGCEWGRGMVGRGGGCIEVIESLGMEGVGE